METTDESYCQIKPEHTKTRIHTHRRSNSIMQATGGTHNCFTMILRSRVLKLCIMLAFSFMFTAVYVNYFQHPPAETILAMNSRGAGSSFGARSFGASQGQNSGGSNRKTRNNNDDDNDVDDDDDDGDGGEGNANNNVEDTVGKRSEGGNSVRFADFWQKLLQRNGFVAIGAVYNRCENWSIQFGTVVLLPDKEFGGVKARTYVNMTLEKEIDGGQFNIAVKYNGKDLYDNYWDTCELEEELPPQNRTFNCPVAAGKHSKVKDKHIPNYLPKGRYQSKSWLTDEDEKVVACGYSDFTI